MCTGKDSGKTEGKKAKKNHIPLGIQGCGMKASGKGWGRVRSKRGGRSLVKSRWRGKTRKKSTFGGEGEKDSGETVNKV